MFDPLPHTICIRHPLLFQACLGVRPVYNGLRGFLSIGIRILVLLWKTWRQYHGSLLL